MAYGFDPSIILAGLPRPPAESSLNDTLLTLAKLRGAGLEQKQQEMGLADLARRREHETQLADIYRQGASAPEGLAAALLRGGFGPQAFAAQDQASQLATQEAQRAKLLRDAQDAHRKRVGELFYGVKTQDGWDAALRELSADPMTSVYAAQIPATFDASVADRLGNLALSAKDRLEAEQKQLDRENRTKNARISASGGLGGAGAELSPEALDAFANQLNATGQITQGLGQGKAAAGIRVKIANRAAELANGGADLAGSKANYSANAESLKAQQKLADQIDAFEATAEKNLDVFLESAKKVANFDSPLFNAPARDYQRQIAGRPEMAAFDAARQTAVTEIGKVLSGAMGNAVLSDSARHEVQDLIRKDASVAQIVAAANILKRDMANRKAAIRAQLSETRSRISGRSRAADSAEASWSDADEARLQELERKAAGW